MVDFQAICEVVYACTAFVGMCNDYDFVAAVDQFRGELVDVAFDASWLREEEVTDHCDIVGHFDGCLG